MQLKSFFMVDTDPSTPCYTLAADYLLTCLLKCMHPKNYAQGLCFLLFVGVGIYVNYTHILQGYITGTERFSNCPSVTMKKHCWQMIDGTWECNNNGLDNKNKIKENTVVHNFYANSWHWAKKVVMMPAVTTKMSSWQPPFFRGCNWHHRYMQSDQLITYSRPWVAVSEYKRIQLRCACN